MLARKRFVVFSAFVKDMFAIPFHVACESCSQIRRCETDPAASSQNGELSC